MAKFKKSLLILLMVPVLVCCMGLLMACGGDTDEGTVVFKTEIKNSKGQIRFGDDTYEWTSEIKKGSSDLNGNDIYVESGYDIKNIAFTIDDGQTSKSMTYRAYRQGNDGTHDYVDLDTFVNDGGTDGSGVHLEYAFPDSKRNYTITVDANTCPGYSCNVDLALKTAGVKVAKTNDQYNDRQNYFQIDHIIGQVMNTSTTNATENHFNGQYGEKLLVLAPEKIALVTKIGEDSTTSATQLKFFGKDYIYTYENQPYYVYSISFGHTYGNSINDVLYEEEDYSAGYQVDYEDLLAVNVVNHLEACTYNYQKMTGYTTAQIKTTDSAYAKREDWPVKFYEIPHANFSGGGDFYYVYRKADGSNVENNAAVTENPAFTNIENYLSDCNSENFNRENYFKTMQNTTLFISVPTALKEHFQLYFQFADGRTFAGTNSKTKLVPSSMYEFKSVAWYRTADDVSIDSDEMLVLDLSTSSLVTLFGEIPTGTINLVLDVDSADLRTDIDVACQFNSLYYGSVPALTVVDADNRTIQSAVMYYEKINWQTLKTAVLRSAVDNTARLQFAFGENPGSRPYYSSITAVVKADGAVLDVNPTFRHGDDFTCYVTFNAADTAAIVAHTNVTIEFDCIELLTNSLSLNLDVPDKLVGQVERATFNKNNYQIGNFQTINDKMLVTLQNDATAGNIYLYRVATGFDTYAMQIQLTYDDDSEESGRKTVDIVYLYQLQDIFGKPVNDHFDCVYFTLKDDNYNRYQNRTYEMVYKSEK